MREARGSTLYVEGQTVQLAQPIAKRLPPSKSRRIGRAVIQETDPYHLPRLLRRAPVHHWSHPGAESSKGTIGLQPLRAMTGSEPPEDHAAD